MKNKITLSIVSLILASVMLFSLYSCTAANEAETEASTVESVHPEDVTVTIMAPKYAESEKSPADFAAELLRLSYASNNNTLVSPLSVAMVLAMAAEGAEGNTEKEFSDLFGGMSTAEVNEYFKDYMEGLTSDELGIANAVWSKKKFPVKDSFTDAVRRFYGADIYAERPFDTSTVEEINGWVKENTDDMIEKIIEYLDPRDVMVLVNTVLFEAEWSEKYDEMQVRDGEFTTRDGTVKNVTMMSSSEYDYLENELATGVMKPYKGNNYAFAALLPKEGVTIDKLIAELDGEMLTETLSTVSHEEVITKIPQFEYEFGIENMAWMLRDMGLCDAFDAIEADFTGICDDAKERQLHISRVIHKTKIELTPVGTKAGAATAVVMMEGSAAPGEPPKKVYLDRPFVYMIVDTDTNLPVFIGAVTDIGE